jgi:hypothetical protein
MVLPSVQVASVVIVGSGRHPPHHDFLHLEMVFQDPIPTVSPIDVA